MNRSSVKPRKSRNILELYHTSAPPLSQAHSHRHQIKSLWSGCRLNFESIQPVNPTLLANTTVLLPAQPLRKMALPKSCRQALPKSCRRALPKSCRQALPNRVGRLCRIVLAGSSKMAQTSSAEIMLTGSANLKSWYHC